MKGLDGSTETVYRIVGSPGGVDGYGDPVASTETRTPIDGVLVAPARSTEASDLGRAGVVTGWSLFMPPGTVLDRSDVVEVRGIRCQVKGEVADWQDAGVVAEVERAEG